MANCDLNLPAGEVVALTGPAGSGKSTLKSAKEIEMLFEELQVATPELASVKLDVKQASEERQFVVNKVTAAVQDAVSGLASRRRSNLPCPNESSSYSRNI